MIKINVQLQIWLTFIGRTIWYIKFFIYTHEYGFVGIFVSTCLRVQIFVCK